MARVTEVGGRNPTKRNAGWDREIIAKKTRPDKIIDIEGLPDDLSDDKLPQQSLGSPDNNSQNLPGEGLRSFQNPLSSASDITHTTKRNFPRGSEKRVLNPDILCVSMKKLKLSEFEPVRVPHDDEKLVFDQRLISNAESLLSEKSENLSPVEDPTMTDTCASDATTNLISGKNGLQCDLVTLPDQSNEISSVENQDQLCSVGNSDKNFNEKSSFNPNNAFCNSFDLDNIDEQEEFSCGKGMSCSNHCLDMSPEDKYLFRALKNVFKKKLKDSTSETETVGIHQTFDEDDFQIHLEQYSQDITEVDIFWDEYDGALNSIEAECQKLETTESVVPIVACPPTSSTNGAKGKKCTINFPSVSYYKKAKKQLHVDKIRDTVECVKTCSSNNEDNIKERSDESKEMEEISSLLSFMHKSGPEIDKKSQK